jgi:hypothetical protein
MKELTMRMLKRRSRNSKLHIQYELKKEKELKYIGYLEKRYGKQRVHSFVKACS